MTRGEVWLADFGGKLRPGVVLTRSEVIAVRSLVSLAEITTSHRRISSEVVIDHEKAGLDMPSAVNCDGIHTISQKSLVSKVGELSDREMHQICGAVRFAFAC